MANSNAHFVKLLTVACLLLVATPLSSECGEWLQADNHFPAITVGYERTNFNEVLNTACFAAGDPKRGFLLANRDKYIIVQEPRDEVALILASHNIVPPDPPDPPPDPPDPKYRPGLKGGSA